MPNIAITDVVTTLILQDIDYTSQGKVRSFPSIAFGNGILLYDTYGIPVPDLRKFGMKKGIKRLYIQAPPNGYVYKFDPTPRVANPVAPDGTIRIFQSGADPGAPSIAAATAGTPAGTIADTPAGTVDPGTHVFTGTPGTPAFTGAELPTHTHVLSGGAGAAGPLVELGNVAVPATVLYLEVIGQ